MRHGHRHHPAHRARLPGWALAVGIAAAGALLAWLHVVVRLGGLISPCPAARRALP